MSHLERHGDDSGSSVVWFIVGAALGAAIGMLFAPKSGRETRRLIADQAEHGRERLSETSRDLRDKSKTVYDRGRHMADEASELFERGRRLVRGEQQAAEGTASPVVPAQPATPSPGEQPA